MDDKKLESKSSDRNPLRKITYSKAADVESDDESTGKAQALMNCIYTGMFLMIGAIFFW